MICSNFCPAPFITISTDVNGEVRPCCRYARHNETTKYHMPNLKDGTIDEIYNGEEFNNLRQAFLNNERPQECSACWIEESTGSHSYRQRFLERSEKYRIDYQTEGHQTPRIIDFKLSNACNLRCRMCCPMSSTSISKEINTLGPIHVGDEVWSNRFTTEEQRYFKQHKIFNTENESIFFNQWLPNIKEIELTGGEPFISLENKKLISKIADTPYAKKIRLFITTNGTQYDQDLIDKMKNFKKVTICISVDDIEQRAEYYRDQSNWNTIIQNYNKFITNPWTVIFSCTISSYNVYNVLDLYNFCIQNNIRFNYSYVFGPEWLNISTLSPRIKEVLTERYKDIENFDRMVQFLNQPNKNLTRKFLQHIKAYDTLRNQSFQQIYPEYYKILNPI